MRGESGTIGVTSVAMELAKYSLLGTSPVASMSISSLGHVFVRLWSYSRLHYLPLLFQEFNENDLLKRRVQTPQKILSSLLLVPILETDSFLKHSLPMLDFTSHNGAADNLIKAVQEVGMCFQSFVSNLLFPFVFNFINESILHLTCSCTLSFFFLLSSFSFTHTQKVPMV